MTNSAKNEKKKFNSVQLLCKQLLKDFEISDDEILEATDVGGESIISSSSLEGILRRKDNKLLTHNIISNFIFAAETVIETRVEKAKITLDKGALNKASKALEALKALEIKASEKYMIKTREYFQHCVEVFGVAPSKIFATGLISKKQFDAVLEKNKTDYKKEDIFNFIKAVKVIADERKERNTEDTALLEYVRFLELNFEYEFETPKHLTSNNFYKYFSKRSNDRELLLLDEYFDLLSRLTLRDIMYYTYLSEHMKNSEDHELEIFLKDKAIDILMQQSIESKETKISSKELVHLITCAFKLTSLGKKSSKELLDNKNKQDIINSLQAKIQKYNSETARNRHVNWSLFIPLLSKNPKHLELLILYSCMSKDSAEQFRNYIDQH